MSNLALHFKAEKEISPKGNIPLCMVLMSEPLMMLPLIMMLPGGVNCSKYFFKNPKLLTETRKENLKNKLRNVIKKIRKTFKNPD